MVLIARHGHETDHGIDRVFSTDGRGSKELIVPAGGLRRPCSPQTAEEISDANGNVRSANNLYMNGPEIFNFAIKTLPPFSSGTFASKGR